MFSLSIESKEYEFEKEKLNLTNEWLNDEINIVEKNDEDLINKIASLKKQSSGKYNQELETHEKLYALTHKNIKNYSEAKEQPYFARLDFREYRREFEKFYIGKFALGDSKSGDEIVIDWRAPIADLYYSGTYGEAYYEAPIGIVNGELALKRKFLIKDRLLKDAFDEGINEIILKSSGGGAEGNALIDEYLRINLEESIGSKLKDVVATIQKEQNYIIRADKNRAIIIQGSAGSGKTTIALHRLAYLLYKYKNKLSGEQILVVAPNKLFLDYISEILPSLGVDKVKQRTFEELAVEILELKGKIYSKDKKLTFILENQNSDELKYITNSSKLKGSTAFKVMMDSYVKLLEKKDIEVDNIKVNDYVLFEAKEIKRMYCKDLVHLPLNKRKDEIKRYYNLKLKDKINNVLVKIDFSYETLISGTKSAMEDGADRRSKLIEIYDERDNKKKEVKSKSKKALEEYFKLWKAVDTKELYLNFFKDKELFNEVTGDKIPHILIDYILKELNENMEESIIDSDDLAPMLYLKFSIDGVPDKYKFEHIVIDEAQDYSIFQLITLRNMALRDSFTIVGDLGQGIYYYKGINNWQKVFKEVFEYKVEYTALTLSYRSTVEIISFANDVLKKQENNLEPATPVLRHGKAPSINEFKNFKDFNQELEKILEEVTSLGKNSVAIIGRTYGECKKIKDGLKKVSNENWELIKDTDSTLKLKRIIIPSYMTKGLEFDCSIIYNCNEENYSNSELDKKILYVALTRALHLEYIFYKDKVSKLIL